jgi:hypothetical protein
MSDTARYRMLGNGWTIPVIEHVLSFTPAFVYDEIKLDKEIDLLSVI